MKSKLKILFCNSDYGSGEQNYYFIKNNKYISKQHSVIISTPVNRKIFLDINCKNKIFVKNYSKSLENKVKFFFYNKKIDFVILGLTYKKNSLENKILKLSKKFQIKSGAIQDFWGNIGYFTKSNNPDVFWVIDKFAKKISIKRLKSSVIKITGSPKYEKKKINIKDSKYPTDNNLVIIGQPIDLPGVKKFYKELSQISLNHKFKFLFLSHPTDKIKSIEFIKKKSGYIKLISKNYLLSILKKNTIIISYNSTIVYDLIYLKYYHKLNSPLILFFQPGKKILKYYQALIGSSNMPLVNEKIVFLFKNKNYLSKILINDDQIKILKNTQLKNSKKYFTKMKSSTIRLNNSIKKIIN